MRLITLLCTLLLALPSFAETSFSIPEHIPLDRSLVISLNEPSPTYFSEEDEEEEEEDEEEDESLADPIGVVEEPPALVVARKRKTVFRPEKIAFPLLLTAGSTAAGVGIASIFLFADKECDDGNEFVGFACNTAVFPVLQFLGTAALVPAVLSPGVAHYKVGHKKRFFATAALRGIAGALILVGANGRADDATDEAANSQIRLGVFSYLGLAAFDLISSGFLPTYKRR